MTRLPRYLLATLLITTASLFSASSAHALVITSETNYTLSEDETISDDLFVGAETITLNGTVEGDVYAFAGMVVINGTITGDLITAGGNVTVTGDIGQDLRAIGGNVQVTNTSIADNASVAGGTVSIDSQSTIGGSAMFAGGSINQAADVSRNLLIAAGNATISGDVMQDLYLGVGSVSLDPATTIGGNLVYSSESELPLPGEASVAGTIRKVIQPSATQAAQVSQQAKLLIGPLWFMWHLGSFLAALLVGVVLLVLCKSDAQQIAQSIFANPVGSLGWGLIVLLVTPWLFIMLLATVVGIPLAIILLALYLISLYVAKIFTSLALGQWIKTKLDLNTTNQYLLLLLGLVSYTILRLIPLLGTLIGLLTILLGLGALFQYLKTTQKTAERAQQLQIS